MKKKPLSKRLKLDKRVISKFNAAKIKGGETRYCIGSNNCGATSGTINCHNTGTVIDCAPWTIGCPIT